MLVTVVDKPLVFLARLLPRKTGAPLIFLKYPTSINVSVLQTAFAVLCFGSRGMQILYGD